MVDLAACHAACAEPLVPLGDREAFHMPSCRPPSQTRTEDFGQRNAALSRVQYFGVGIELPSRKDFSRPGIESIEATIEGIHVRFAVFMRIGEDSPKRVVVPQAPVNRLVGISMEIFPVSVSYRFRTLLQILQCSLSVAGQVGSFR